MASPKPQVIVRREFELVPDVSAQPLNACIIGPASRVVDFLSRDDLIEGLSIQDPVDAPEYSGHIEGVTGSARVTKFITAAGDTLHGSLLATGLDASSEAISVSSGYVIEADTVTLNAEDAFVRLMGALGNEDDAAVDGGFGGATQYSTTANVVDCGVSVVTKPGYPRSSLLADDVKVGDQVYIDVDTSTGGSNTTFITSVIGFQTETTGQVKRIVLANNVFANDTDVVDALSIRRRISAIANIPEVGGETTEASWKYDSGDGKIYYGGHNGTTGGDLGTDGMQVNVPELGSGWFDMTSAVMYVGYTAFRADLPMEVSTIESLSDIDDIFGTDLHPSNLLAWALYTAKSNAGAQPVYYIPTPDQQLTSYVSALAQAETERSCYSIVPLSAASDVMSAVEGHVDNMSAPEEGKFRIGWFAPEIARGRIVTDYSTNGLSETLTYTDAGDGAAPDASTTVVRITSSGTDSFKDANVGAIIYSDVGSAPSYDAFVAGDYSGNDRDEVRITSVLNNDEVEATIVKIASGNSDVLPNTATDAILYEDVTGSTLAQEYATTASGFDNERIFAVVPDRGISGMRVNGVGVKNVHLAAAFAGLRSTSAVQQPLSNVTINGFDTLNSSEVIFSETNFSTMRDAGVWVVRQPRTGNQAGKIFAQRQLSTNNLDIYRKEQSVTTNIDNIAFALLDGLFGYVGRVNITDATIALIRDSIETILRGKTSANTATLGPQLASYEITSLEQVSSSLGTLKVAVALQVPLPMNIIDLTLVI
jgi:hypothetical protein